MYLSSTTANSTDSLRPLIGVILLGAILAQTVWTSSASAQAEGGEPTGLSLEEQSLKSRFERLEAVAARLAELAAKSEPERAKQLRRAIRASREKGITEQFGTIVRLLESERLSAASRDQVALQKELESLLQLLLEDPGNAERNARKRFLKEQIRQLGKLIRQQRSVRGQTEEGAEGKRLADDQSDLEKEAAKIQKALDEAAGKDDASQEEASEGEGKEGKAGEGKKGEGEAGKPSEGEGEGGEGGKGDKAQKGQGGQGGQGGEGGEGESSEDSPSSDPMKKAAQRVKAAQKAMKKAEEKLRKAKRDGAADEQRKAQRELEAARAELERILRQLREEEQERLLTKLIARFREMLATQRAIYDKTVTIQKEAFQGGGRTSMLQSIRLSRRESELVREAEKALLLLKEDGTSVAFPETVEQIAEDMRSVTGRLGGADTGPITQTVELDILAGLEDMIAALEKARDELARKQQQKSPPPGQAGQSGEAPLVSILAELRMIRTLQARVYQRTKNLGVLTENPQVNPDDLKGEIAKLSYRQQRIFKATHDLDTKANQ